MFIRIVIAERRKERGLSQEQLAEIVGFPKSTVSEHERDRRRASLEKLLQYAEALDCGVLDLFEILPAETDQ